MENPAPGMSLTSPDNLVETSCCLSALPEFSDERIRCSYLLQVAVMDRLEGAAHVLVDLLSRLHAEQLAYFVIDNDESILDRLDDFEVVFLGLDYYIVSSVALLTQIRSRYPSLPIIAVVRDSARVDLTDYESFNLDMVIELPGRSAALKVLLRTLTERYLDCRH